jgi:hypothetical protein
VSGFQANLATGLAVYLAAAGIGATWDPTSAYTDLQTGIILGKIPTTPDRIITLSVYGVEDDPDLSDSVLGVQVRCRWPGEDIRLVDDLADSIFMLLHGKTDWPLAVGIYIVQCLLNSGPVSLGQDANNRWSNSQNFYCTVHRPSTNRT